MSLVFRVLLLSLCVMGALAASKKTSSDLFSSKTYTGVLMKSKPYISQEIKFSTNSATLTSCPKTIIKVESSMGSKKLTFSTLGKPECPQNPKAEKFIKELLKVDRYTLRKDRSIHLKDEDGKVIFYFAAREVLEKKNLIKNKSASKALRVQKTPSKMLPDSMYNMTVQELPKVIIEVKIAKSRLQMFLCGFHVSLSISGEGNEIHFGVPRRLYSVECANDKDSRKLLHSLFYGRKVRQVTSERFKILSDSNEVKAQFFKAKTQ